MNFILNAGHGAKQSGKRSPYIVPDIQFYEYEFNRDIVRRIATGLHLMNIDYTVLMPDPNIDSDLKLRVDKANEIHRQKESIYISIHANANGDGVNWNDAEGIETWYYKDSTKGKQLASLFQQNLMNLLSSEFVDRGIRANNNINKAFYELRKTTMPSVLTENGFYTNQIEVNKLLSENYRQKIADAHIKSIVYLDNYGFDGIDTYHKNVILG